MKIFARERYYIKESSLDKKTIEKIIKQYTFHFFDEKSCSKCEWRQLRIAQGLLGECEVCAAYTGSAILASKVKVKDNSYIATPLGDYDGLSRTLRSAGYDCEKVEKHRIYPIKPIKFTGTLRDYQVEAVDTCIKGEKGVLEAAPRTGKTVMLSAIICKLSVKSLIIASQHDWLMGFYETFVGSDTQKALTDLDKSRIGFCKKLSDFEKYDVCLATVQTFHSENGQQLLKKLRDSFTLVGIDEVHTSSANKYIQEISRFNCKYKIGLTGTPDRKDGRYPLTAAVVGPVIYQAKVKRLRPEIKLTKTSFYDGSRSTVWAYIVRKIENDEKRLNLIADCAIKDANAGHMVLIPFAQVKPIHKLVSIINEKAGKNLAYPFFGGLKKNVRDKTIQDAREYKIKILVGQTKLMSVGINIPRASCLYYCISPSSNTVNATQRVSRILTPYENKPQPIIRIFLDDLQVQKSCLNNEWWRCIKPTFNPIISERDNSILTTWLANRNNYVY